MVPPSLFEIVVRRHQAAVRHTLLTLTDGDEMTADDLAQETFIRAFQAWDTFRALASPKTWLLRIAYTTFCDYLRSQHDSESLDNYFFHSSSPSESPSCGQDLQHDVAVAMQQLTPAERLCVQLFLVEDLSLQQVASITRLNINTVKSHILRGKDKLKTFLIQNGYDR